MIKFLGLRYKNTLAVGNNWIEISFNNGTKNLIIGKNGAGKSTMIEALCFVLYNKAFSPVKLGDLINSINQKNMVVEVYFEIGKTQYIIKRGLKPNFCELYIDGVLKNQDASVRDYQNYIEKSVLKMDEKTFRQVVVLGSNSYVPFMQLPAAKKRVVVEDLLDLGIFGSMAVIAKKMISEAKREYLDVMNKSQVLDAKIGVLNSQIDANQTDDQELIDGYLKKIKIYENQILVFNDQIKEFQEQVEEINVLTSVDHIQELLKGYGKDKANLTFEINSTQKDIDFFNEHDSCPSCKQEITEELSNNRVDELEESNGQFKDSLTRVSADYDSVKNSLDEHNEKLNQINELNVKKNDVLNQKNSALDNISVTKSHISALEQKKNNASNTIATELKTLSCELQNISAQMNDMKHYGKRLSYISDMLKDTGIKSNIIKTYIPIINQLMRKYLDIMNFSVDFQFDEMFNETIKSRGRDRFSYAMFSEGEKLRMDLAILFTWRELAKLKNSASTNLLIFDEIGDSSLDAEGFDMFVEVLDNDKTDQCCFIISHKPEGLESKVNMIYEFEKVHDFTTLKSKTRADVLI